MIVMLYDRYIQYKVGHKKKRCVVYVQKSIENLQFFFSDLYFEMFVFIFVCLLALLVRRYYLNVNRIGLNQNLYLKSRRDLNNKEI